MMATKDNGVIDIEATVSPADPNTLHVRPKVIPPPEPTPAAKPLVNPQVLAFHAVAVLLVKTLTRMR